MGKISRTALAEKWGVSPSYIDNLVQAGKLERVGRGTFDEDDAEALRAQMDIPKRVAAATVKASGGQQRPAKNGTTGNDSFQVHQGGKSPAQETPMMKARTMREVMQARSAELNFKKQAGELVEAATVKAGVFTVIRVFTQRARALPIRLGPQVAVEEDAQQCVALISEEIETMLSELQDELASL